ncbi:hypothetical protein D3C76_616780 [compost metagenome]
MELPRHHYKSQFCFSILIYQDRKAVAATSRHREMLRHIDLTHSITLALPSITGMVETVGNVRSVTYSGDAIDSAQ